MSPTPGLRHQRAAYRLHVALDAAARAAGAPVKILEAINVTLPSGLVVPDIVVTDAGAASIGPEAVLLVVERGQQRGMGEDRLQQEAGGAAWRAAGSA